LIKNCQTFVKKCQKTAGPQVERGEGFDSRCTSLKNLNTLLIVAIINFYLRKTGRWTGSDAAKLQCATKAISITYRSATAAGWCGDAQAPSSTTISVNQCIDYTVYSWHVTSQTSITWPRTCHCRRHHSNINRSNSTLQLRYMECSRIRRTVTLAQRRKYKKSVYALTARHWSQCWNWPKRTGGGGGSAGKMFEILPRDWNLKPIFTQKWVSVDINWGFNPPTPPTIATLTDPQESVAPEWDLRSTIHGYSDCSVCSATVLPSVDWNGIDETLVSARQHNA